MQNVHVVVLSVHLIGNSIFCCLAVMPQIHSIQSQSTLLVRPKEDVSQGIVYF